MDSAAKPSKSGSSFEGLNEAQVDFIENLAEHVRRYQDEHPEAPYGLDLRINVTQPLPPTKPYSICWRHGHPVYCDEYLPRA
jgi:hypothetical protein